LLSNIPIQISPGIKGRDYISVKIYIPVLEMKRLNCGKQEKCLDIYSCSGDEEIKLWKPGVMFRYIFLFWGWRE